MPSFTRRSPRKPFLMQVMDFVDRLHRQGSTLNRDVAKGAVEMENIYQVGPDAVAKYSVRGNAYVVTVETLNKRIVVEALSQKFTARIPLRQLNEGG